MKLLIFCPGRILKSPSEISCFTDNLSFYLPLSLTKIANTTVVTIPDQDCEELRNIFSTIDVAGYDAIITLGLRYYSRIPRDTTNLLRNRFAGLLCQVYDGSRQDKDPVDITFTFKDSQNAPGQTVDWYSINRRFNEYMGWAADPELNIPKQSATELRILVDHTNYANGREVVDKTKEVLLEIKEFVKSGIWTNYYSNVSVRRFDSGSVVEVDLDDLNYEQYDKNKRMSYTEITKEHCAAHIFCVTHPESVGLVVLETALAGALVVAPKRFIPADRLKTVRHYEWEESIDWDVVLKSINPQESRNIALKNSWDAMATNIVNALTRRLKHG